ncbi:MAG TPA: cupin domain-containing protein [Burkholderiales bacterium]|nr:cupin domain-containing protein [Burkholderiales bacterium]
MDTQAFTAAARAEGYDEIVEREMPAGFRDAEHQHAFDARILVTEGEFTITMRGATRTYHPGESFEVPAGTPHAEAVGETALHFTVARRHRKT